MPTTLLIDALAGAPSADAGVGAILRDDVRFRSPYADYAGRADVGHLVGLIRGVLVEVRPASTLRDHDTTMSVFDARVEGEEVQGVLVERHDDTGRVADAMLTIRPYAGLRAAMQAMRVVMEASPLPSRRSA